MSRSLIWALVIIGALLVFRLLTSDTQTHLTPQQQMQQMVPIYHLSVYAFFWSIPVVFLVLGYKRYKESGNWVFLLPFIGIVVLYGGIWAWFGYFADHGAFLAWPLIIVCILAILTVIWCVDDYRRQKAIREGMMRSDVPTEVDHGPANPEDFKDW